MSVRQGTVSLPPATPASSRFKLTDHPGFATTLIGEYVVAEKAEFEAYKREKQKTAEQIISELKVRSLLTKHGKHIGTVPAVWVDPKTGNLHAKVCVEPVGTTPDTEEACAETHDAIAKKELRGVSLGTLVLTGPDGRRVETVELSLCKEGALPGSKRIGEFTEMRFSKNYSNALENTASTSVPSKPAAPLFKFTPQPLVSRKMDAQKPATAAPTGTPATATPPAPAPPKMFTYKRAEPLTIDKVEITGGFSADTLAKLTPEENELAKQTLEFRRQQQLEAFNNNVVATNAQLGIIEDSLNFPDMKDDEKIAEAFGRFVSQVTPDTEPIIAAIDKSTKRYNTLNEEYKKVNEAHTVVKDKLTSLEKELQAVKSPMSVTAMRELVRRYFPNNTEVAAPPVQTPQSIPFTTASNSSAPANTSFPGIALKTGGNAASNTITPQGTPITTASEQRFSAETAAKRPYAAFLSGMEDAAKGVFNPYKLSRN
jgi:hypothetical protein